MWITVSGADDEILESAMLTGAAATTMNARMFDAAVAASGTGEDPDFAAMLREGAAG